MNWEDGPLDPEEAGINMDDVPHAEGCEDDECNGECFDPEEPDYEAIIERREQDRYYRED